MDRAYYIQCGLRPVPESRLCEYLWRKKWLGQWTRQLFIIKHDSLLVRRKHVLNEHLIITSRRALDLCLDIIAFKYIFLSLEVF